MNAESDLCELCDLPLSQCIHGRPPPPPAPAPAPRTRTPRAPRTPGAAKKATTKPVVRRWTPPEHLAPVILELLQEAGGSLPAEEALRRIEERLTDRWAAGDHERTPTGELRWQYAARRARAALVKDGALAQDEPGVWRLA